MTEAELQCTATNIILQLLFVCSANEQPVPGEMIEANLLQSTETNISSSISSRVLVQEQQQQQQNSSKGWDGSTLSKEEMGAMARSREEAAIKRVRALQYASLQNVNNPNCQHCYILLETRTVAG